MKSLSFLSKNLLLFCSVLCAVESGIEVPTGNPITKKNPNEVQTKFVTRVRRIKKIKTTTAKDEENSISPAITLTNDKKPEDIEKKERVDETVTSNPIQINKVSGKVKTITRTVVRSGDKKNEKDGIVNTVEKLIQEDTASKTIDENLKKSVTVVNSVEKLLNVESINFNNSTGNTVEKLIQSVTSSKTVDENSQQPVSNFDTVEKLIQSVTSSKTENFKPKIDANTVEKLIQADTSSKTIDQNLHHSVTDVNTVEKLIQTDSPNKTEDSKPNTDVNAVETSTSNSTTKTKTKRTKVYVITSTLSSKLALIERKQLNRTRKEFLETLKGLENKTVILRPVIKTSEKIFIPIKIVRPVLIPKQIKKDETTAIQTTLSVENKTPEKFSNENSVPVVIVGKSTGDESQSFNNVVTGENIKILNPIDNDKTCSENGKCLNNAVTGEQIKISNTIDNDRTLSSNALNNSPNNEVILKPIENDKSLGNNVLNNSVANQDGWHPACNSNSCNNEVILKPVENDKSLGNNVLNNSVTNQAVWHPVNNGNSCPNNHCNNTLATDEEIKILYPISQVNDNQENKVNFSNSEYKILLPHKISPVISKPFDFSSQEFKALEYFVQFAYNNPKKVVTILKDLDVLVGKKKITNQTFFKLHKLSTFYSSEHEKEYVKGIFHHYRSLTNTAIKNQNLNILIRKMNLLFTDKFIELLAKSSPSQVIEVIKTALYNRFSLHFDLAFRHIGEEILIIADQTILFANEELKQKGRALEECLAILQRDGNSKEIKSAIIGRITELIFESLEIAGDKRKELE